VPALLNFNNKVSELFPTCDIKSVRIEVPKEEEEGEEGEGEEKEPGKSSITLSLKIYAL